MNFVSLVSEAEEEHESPRKDSFSTCSLSSLSIKVPSKGYDSDSESDYSDDEYSDDSQDSFVIMRKNTRRNQVSLTPEIISPRNDNFEVDELVFIRNSPEEEWKPGRVKKVSPLRIAVEGTVLRQKFTYVRKASPSNEDDEGFLHRQPSFETSLDSFDLDMTKCRRVTWKPRSPNRLRAVSPSTDVCSVEALVSTIDVCLMKRNISKAMRDIIQKEYLFLDMDYFQSQQTHFDSEREFCFPLANRTPVLESRELLLLKAHQQVQTSLTEKSTLDTEGMLWGLQRADKEDSEWCAVIFVGKTVIQRIEFCKIFVRPIPPEPYVTADQIDLYE